MAPGKAPRISRFHVLTTRDNATKVLCPRLVRVPATHVPSSVHRRNACQERWRGFWDSGRGRALTFIFESGVKPGFLEFLSVLLIGNILFKTPALLAPPPLLLPRWFPQARAETMGERSRKQKGIWNSELIRHTRDLRSPCEVRLPTPRPLNECDKPRGERMHKGICIVS